MTSPKQPTMFDLFLSQAANACAREEPPSWPLNPFPKGMREGSATEKVMAALMGAHPRWLEHWELMRACGHSRGAVAWGLRYLQLHGFVRSVQSAKHPQYLRYQSKQAKPHTEDIMTALIKYDAACRALQEAKAVDEVKDLRDKADAIRIYAMQAKNKTLEIDAAEIRIRAERRLGEMITIQKETVGLNTGTAGKGRPNLGGSQSEPPKTDSAPTLSDAGIDKKLSMRAQQMAAIPADEFESEVGEWRERVSAENERVTIRLQKAGEKAAKKSAKKVPVSPAVLEVVVSDEVAALREDLAQWKERALDMEVQARETLDDNNSMAVVFESNDPLAAAMAEVKKHREMNRILEERVRGLQGECSAAKKAAVMWRRKFEALEKLLSQAAA